MHFRYYSHSRAIIAILLLTVGILAVLLWQKKTADIPNEINTATAGYLSTICSRQENDRDKFLCIGRVSGFVAGWVTSDAIDAAVNTNPNKRQMCPEQYVNKENPLIALGVFLEWMKQHPEAESWYYTEALAAALSEAFICEQQQEQSSQIQVQKFQARSDEADALEKLSKFISKNNGGIVYIDTFIPQKMAFKANDMAGFTITIDCEESYGCPGDEYIINLPENTDAMYQYVPRLEAYHIKGYWAVMTGTAFNQGISSNVLRGVATEAVTKN